MLTLPNVVRPCCREAAALRGAHHAKRGGAAAPRNVRQMLTHTFTQPGTGAYARYAREGLWSE